MSTAYKCDVCGALSQGRAIAQIDLERSGPIPPEVPFSEGDELDVCKPCWDTFILWYKDRWRGGHE